LREELEQRGFSSEIHIEYTLGPVRWTELMALAERREISSLAQLSEGAYSRGLARLRRIHAAQPEGTGAFELALLTCTAVLPA
jgi:hypothetical protein